MQVPREVINVGKRISIGFRAVIHPAEISAGPLGAVRLWNYLQRAGPRTARFPNYSERLELFFDFPEYVGG